MKYGTQNLVLIGLLGGALGACQSDDSDAVNPNDALFEEQQQTITDFLEAQDIATQQTATGIHYRVLTENTDGTAPAPGNTIHLYYHIEQLNGSLVAELDSSQNDAITYTFAYSGPNRTHVTLPRGLDGMASLMREGEEYEFFLPSGLAYLDFELPGVIPANAIVRARIYLDKVLTAAEQRRVEDHKIKEYLAAESLTGFDSLASGVYYATTEVGDTSVQATPSSIVEVRYTGLFLDGTVFDSNTGANDNLYEVIMNGTGKRRPIEGFLTGLRQMNLGEKGTILIPSHAGYGQGVVAIPQTFVKDLNLQEPGSLFTTIPPYAILRFDVEVVTIK